MVGTFSNVRKSLSCYCFIDGADGKSYFCHRDYLKDKHDWKFVWNGNECSFKIRENPDADKKDIAVDIIPLPIVNQNIKKAEKARDEKQKRKERNIAIAIQHKENKDKWESHIKEHFCYTLMSKKRDTSNPYVMVQPVTVWKDKLSAEESLFFHKAEKGDINHYQFRKAVVYKVGGVYIVKELLNRNKVGSVLYQGNLKFN